MNTLLILLQKEFKQFFRNPFLPKMLVMFPVMVMLIIPLVTTMDVKNVNIAVVDNDKSALSRRIISDLNASGSLTVASMSPSDNDAYMAVETDNADAILQIPSGLEKSADTGAPLAIELSVNGVNAIKGMIGSQYAIQSVSHTLKASAEERGIQAITDNISVQYLYNPTLDYRIYMIPALMIVLLIMICGFLPALNLVGEKDSGTIEQINVSPVGRTMFTMSKLIPYWIIGLLVLTVAMLIARMVYGLSPAGALWHIYLAAILFILFMSGLGIAIANFSVTMQQSVFVMFFFIVIFQLMSGLMTPISSMPQWAQAITYGIPPRYYIEIMRSVYLKATTLAQLIPQLAALASFAALACIVATATYRKQS